MKSTPDESTIARWFEGQLSGEELTKMDAYAAENKELLTQRDAFQMTSEELRKIPESVEPPYPDFFNSQVQKLIREEERTSESRPGSEKTSSWFERWSAWFAPAAVVAMVACFYAGTQVSRDGFTQAATVSNNAALYTPYGDVDAQVVHSVSTGSTVIVLDGLEAIPDSVDMVNSYHAEGESGIVGVGRVYSTY